MITSTLYVQIFTCSQKITIKASYRPFFLIWGDTRSLRKPALRPASQAGPMRNPERRDTIRLT